MSPITGTRNKLANASNARIYILSV